MMMYAGTTPPTGWLTCDGSSVSRTTYAALFAIIGTAYGSAGPSVFDLPDFRGNTVRGANGSYPLGTDGGADTVALTANNLPTHTHSITDPGHTHDVVLTDLYSNGGSGSAITYVGQLPGGGAGNRTQPAGATLATTGITGTGNNSTTQTPISIVNSYTTANFIIKF